jgi:hypothetical protein
MKFIERDLIDTEKWDALVSNSKDSSIFSMSFYLDIVADNWCIFVDEDYTRGIALPYQVSLGIKCCYTPPFVRYLEWCGQSMDDFRFMTELKHYFPAGRLHTKHKIRTRKLKRWVYQKIDSIAQTEYSPQTLRIFEKFERSELDLNWDINQDLLMHQIRSESGLKAHSLNRKTISVLDKLIQELNHKGFLKTLVVSDSSTFHGGVFLISFNDMLMQLRHSFSRNAKEMGASYGVLQHAICEAHERGLVFDFGGSNAESVKRTHYNLGGEDAKYYVTHWDRSPSWHKFLVRVKNLFLRGTSF